MSVDLNFWKYRENAVQDHAAVYLTACCDGEVMEELEILSVDDILKKVADSFPDWTIHEGGKDFEKEGHGAFQIFTTSQVVRFDCCGICQKAIYEHAPVYGPDYFQLNDAD